MTATAHSLSAGDLEIDGELTCTADITTDSTVTASCDGTTTSGAAVAGTLDGTTDVDAETCSAHLVVLVDEEPVTDHRIGVSCQPLIISA